MTQTVTDFIKNNYDDYEAIVKEELFPNMPPPSGFYETFLLTVIPAMRKINSSSELYPIVKVQLLNFFHQNDLPSKEKLFHLSSKLFKHYNDRTRDRKTEKLNILHAGIGLALIFINISFFILMEIFVGGGFSLGILFSIIGIIIWFLPSVSGFLALNRNKKAYFGSGHYLWMLMNVLFIAIFTMTFIRSME